MIVIPSINLRDGCGVQLGVGAPAPEVVRIPDPVAESREFARIGFSRLHIMDLDAAAGHGSNFAVSRELIRESGVEIQVGGGVMDEEGATEQLDAGARWVVITSRAMPDLDAVSDLATACPGEVILAVDIRFGRVAASGRVRGIPRYAVDLTEEVADLPLAGILINALGHEGHPGGPDLRLIEDVVEVARVPVLAAGGIATVAHLRNLEDRGAAGAVVGSALYTGTLNASAVAAEFAA